MLLLSRVEKLNFRRSQCCCNYFAYQNIAGWSEALKCFSLLFLSQFLSSISLSPLFPSPLPFFPGLQCLATWWYEKDWLSTLDSPLIYLGVLPLHKSYLSCQNVFKVFLWFYLLNQQSGELSCSPLGERRVWFALQWFLWDQLMPRPEFMQGKCFTSHIHFHLTYTGTLANVTLLLFLGWISESGAVQLEQVYTFFFNAKFLSICCIVHGRLSN